MVNRPHYRLYIIIECLCNIYINVIIILVQIMLTFLMLLFRQPTLEMAEMGGYLYHWNNAHKDVHNVDVFPQYMLIQTLILWRK